MIDIILIITGFFSIIFAVLGSIYINKTNSVFSDKELKTIQMLREEKLLLNKNSYRRKKSVSSKIKILNVDDQNLIYQTAREKNISVGELLLAAKINSLK